MLIESIQNLGEKLDFSCINYATLNEMGLLSDSNNEFDIILTKLVEKNHIYFFLVIPIKNCLSGVYRFSADKIRYIPDDASENENEVQQLNKFYEFSNQLITAFNDNSSLANEIIQLSHIEISGEMGSNNYLYKKSNSQVKIMVFPCILCSNPPHTVISERIISLNPTLNLHLKEKLEMPFPYFANCNMYFLTENTISEFLDYIIERSTAFIIANENKEEEQLRETNYFNFIFSYGFLTIGIIDLLLLFSSMVLIQSIFIFSIIGSLFLFIVTWMLNKNQRKKYSDIQRLKNFKIFPQINLLTEPNIKDLISISSDNIKFRKQILLEHFLFWNSNYEKSNIAFIRNYSEFLKNNNVIFENSRKLCYESILDLDKLQNKYSKTNEVEENETENNKKEKSITENNEKEKEKIENKNNHEKISQSVEKEKSQFDYFADYVIYE